MRRVSKTGLSMWLVLAFVISGAALTAHAQDTDSLYVISAKAGKVNLVSGKVTFQRKGTTGWETLAAKKNLDTGDVLKTDADGRAEMLLNPGSFMRIAENSEVKLIDASLDNLQLGLTKGSAIIEASGTDGTRLLAQISTPQTKITLDRNGLYRINVLPTGATEVLVHKGRVLVGNDSGTKVKGGKKIVVGSGGTEVVKFDKKNRDDLDEWSKKRAETLIAANRKLSRQDIVSALTSFRRNGAYGYGYAPYFGLWIFDSGLSCYTFFPFYSGWSSPYGFGYARNFGLPWYYYQPVQQLPVGSSTGGATGGNTPGGGTGGGAVGNNPMPPVEGAHGRPPFRRISPDDPVDPDRIRPPHPFPGESGDSTGRFDRDLGRRDGVDRRSEEFDRGFGGRHPAEPVYQPSPTYTPPPSPPPSSSPPVDRMERHESPEPRREVP